MISKITLYKADIIPSRNMWVDNIEEYLADLPNNIVISNHQYIKNDSELDIILDLSQKETDGVNFPYNYLSVVTSNEPQTCYYFIQSFKWASQESVKVHIVLDTINTFMNENTRFSPKTTIIREHRDRFFKKSKLGNLVNRKIDRVDEGINPIKYKDTRNSKEIINEDLDIDFYLMYKTGETEKLPVECFLIPQIPLLIRKGSAGGNAVIIYPNDINNFLNYYLTFEDNPQGTFSYFENGRTYNVNIRPNTIIVYNHADGNFISIKELTYTQKGTSYEFVESRFITKLASYITFENMAFSRYTKLILTDYDAIMGVSTKYNINAGTIADVFTIGINDLNRSLPNIVKIIKLPYAPVELSLDVIDNKLIYDTNIWKFIDGKLLLKDLNAEFINTISQAINFLELEVELPADISYRGKNPIYESKLFNSAFYSKKLVYDSFEYEIPFELYKQEGRTTNLFCDLEFKASNTGNSNFLFHIKDADKLFESTLEYPFFMNVSRNNEIAIYNNEYLNYVKNGYNYDKKAKERANSLNWLNTGLQIAGAGLSFALAPITGNLSLVGGAGMISSAISSIASNISANNAAEDSIRQRLQAARNSNANIAGSDDIDLMTYYSNNRAKLSVYKASALMQDSLFDLFFYCGYSHPTQEIPALNTREYFNYIQCDPIFEKDTFLEIRNNYLEDIINRFKIGVTKYHKSKITNQYDFNQQLENWETWLYEN